MVLDSLAKRVGLLVLAAGLAFAAPAASQESKAGNPAAHGAEAAIDPNPEAEGHKSPPPPSPALHQAPPKANVGDESPGKATDEHESKGPTWTDKTQAFSAVVVMIFTAFLAWLSWRQHKLETTLAKDTGDSIAIARRASDAARRSAIASITAVKDQRRRSEDELRAYLLPDTARARPGVPGQTEWKVTATVRNFGRTPARDVKLKMSRTVAEKGQPLAIYSNQTDPIAAVLGRDNRLEATMTFPLTEAEQAKLVRRELTISIGVDVTYTDHFFNARSTYFWVSCIDDKGTVSIVGQQHGYT